MNKLGRFRQIRPFHFGLYRPLQGFPGVQLILFQVQAVCGHDDTAEEETFWTGARVAGLCLPSIPDSQFSMQGQAQWAGRLSSITGIVRIWQTAQPPCIPFRGCLLLGGQPTQCTGGWLAPRKVLHGPRQLSNEIHQAYGACIASSQVPFTGHLKDTMESVIDGEMCKSVGVDNCICPLLNSNRSMSGWHISDASAHGPSVKDKSCWGLFLQAQGPETTLAWSRPFERGNLMGQTLQKLLPPVP